MPRLSMFIGSALPCAAAMAAFFGFQPASGAPPAAVSLPRPAQPGSGQIFYFVLTDRYSNGTTANDTGGIAGGRDDHGFDPAVVSHYHGGDLVGLTSQIDYIEGLGVTAIWLTPPLKNKAVQDGTAGYHGYWILDFERIDPHLGTNEEFGAFVERAHARGIRVCMDVILNHTADVIVPEGRDVTYRGLREWPLRDASGRPFDERDFAWNGVGIPRPFPELSAESSFPHRPTVPAAETHAKNPAWLNDVRYYHNRGNTDFTGEKSVFGDFVGLDDLFTEHPDVVRGMIEVYAKWIRDYRVDGFRIDTAKHTNIELWQAFGPAMHAAAREAGVPSFFAFGEVFSDALDATLLSEFSTLGTLDASIDFGFASAVRDFVGRGGASMALKAFFEQDDLYTDFDSTAASLPTFISNHDQGRFGYFVQQLDPSADADRQLALSKLGHALLFLARGQPVLYYGDEQGMVGRGGNDMQARESMFASRAPDFRDAPLLGTTRTGADDKFDPSHPLYRHIAGLTALRKAHRALNGGAMVLRRTHSPHVFAFSRIDRDERVEYLVAINNARDTAIEVEIPTSQPEGATLRGVYRLGAGEGTEAGSMLTVGPARTVCARVPALGALVWRADAALPATQGDLAVSFVSPAGTCWMSLGTREIDGQALTERKPLEVHVEGGDGMAEVTFLMTRSSRPDGLEYLGTDDAPPYRVFWRPPSDLGKDETVTFQAVVDDLRGHRAVAVLPNLHVIKPLGRSGIAGAVVPGFSRLPDKAIRVPAGEAFVLECEATGTPDPDFHWFCDGGELSGETVSSLRAQAPMTPGSHRYVVVARNVAGAAVSHEIEVEVTPMPAQP